MTTNDQSSEPRPEFKLPILALCALSPWKRSLGAKCWWPQRQGGGSAARKKRPDGSGVDVRVEKNE